MLNLYSHLRNIVMLIVCFGLTAGHAMAAETHPDGRLFPSSANALADVQRALDRAEDKGRLVLVVLGANWCHDSRALASRLGQAPLAELIEQHYELVFVDVGFLDKGRDVVQAFNVAHYYATPTVLIIDAASGRLINDEDRHQWSNAYNINMSTSVEYFEKWLEDDTAGDSVQEAAELEHLFAEIDAFEQVLAERVASGYAVVGPLLEAYKSGDRSEEFDERWNELRRFRGAIPGDMQELKDDVRRRVATGEQDIELRFPEYPLLSWETD
jgi:thiol-disulfide isomerase/thioredoxin